MQSCPLGHMTQGAADPEKTGCAISHFPASENTDYTPDLQVKITILQKNCTLAHTHIAE